MCGDLNDSSLFAGLQQEVYRSDFQYCLWLCSTLLLGCGMWTCQNIFIRPWLFKGWINHYPCTWQLYVQGFIKCKQPAKKWLLQVLSPLVFQQMEGERGTPLPSCLLLHPSGLLKENPGSISLGSTYLVGSDLSTRWYYPTFEQHQASMRSCALSSPGQTKESFKTTLLINWCLFDLQPIK